jgi:hypothetical protein
MPPLSLIFVSSLSPPSLQNAKDHDIKTLIDVLNGTGNVGQLSDFCVHIQEMRGYGANYAHQQEEAFFVCQIVLSTQRQSRHQYSLS